jgi:hypothetical protein
MNGVIRMFGIALIGGALVGCATPKPVLELASQGVVLTSKTETELESFVARSNRVYRQRLASIKRLASSDIDANAQTEFENYTAQRAGMQAQAELMKLIHELSDYRSKTREKASKQHADIEKTLGVSGDLAAMPKDKLSAAKRAFAELSEEMTREEWLKFTYSYGKEVDENIERLKESAETAENKAGSAAKK